MSENDKGERQLLPTLRRETRQEHEVLEKNTRLRNLVSPELGQDTYIDILLRFSALFEEFERDILNHPEWEVHGFDMKSRLKCPLLKQDLAWFGKVPLETQKLTGSNRLYSEDFPSVMGTLYVTEGSTLGGQVIARNLKANLNLDSSGGAAYFNGYGEETGLRWRAFCSLLESYSREPSDREQSVNAARHAFRVFQKVMA